MKSYKNLLIVGCLASAGALHGTSCSNSPEESVPELGVGQIPSSAHAVIAEFKSRFRMQLPQSTVDNVMYNWVRTPNSSLLLPAQAERIELQGDVYRPQFSREVRQGVMHPATVKLPAAADGVFEVADDDSGLSMGVKLVGASNSSLGEDASGYLVYRQGHENGADIVHRPMATGTEDFLIFEKPPAEEEIVYELHLGARVAGMRVVEGVVELLDTRGAPRLRMSSARVIDAAGQTQNMRVHVDGCTYDTDPRAPWGRPITDPQSRMCVVHLAWQGGRYPLVVDPLWTATGAMSTSRYFHTATLLNLGAPDNVLMVTGGNDGIAWLNSTELWDPNTNTWAMSGNMAGTGRGTFASVLLQSGKVLVAGGSTSGGVALPNSELFNPATGTWANTTGALNVARSYLSLTLLQNGQALAVGGVDTSNVGLTSVERFDPGTETWTTIAPLPQMRAWHTATRLSDGRVLVAGGYQGFNCGTLLSSIVLFDPGTSTWSSPCGSCMSVTRLGHTASLVGSKVLVTGGGYNGNCDASNTVESFDPMTNQWTLKASMAQARRDHGMLTLLDGRAMVAGGNAGVNLATAEVYDLNLNQWSSAGIINFTRSYNTLTLLSDGRALAVGGSGVGPTADIFDFANLANGAACTRNTNCQSALCVDGVCCTVAACTAIDPCHDIGTCQPGTGICSNPAKSDGSSCNDNDACTQSDTCVAGTCTGANPVTCSASDQCHVAGTCNSMTGICSNPNKSDGSSCNDNDACTQTDVCQSGLCTGTNDVVCKAQDDCHDPGACNLATGVCDNPAKPDDTPCGTNGTCKAGVCETPGTGGSGGSAIPPLKPCTSDTECPELFACEQGKCQPLSKGPLDSVPVCTYNPSNGPNRPAGSHEAAFVSLGIAIGLMRRRSRKSLRQSL